MGNTELPYHRFLLVCFDFPPKSGFLLPLRPHPPLSPFLEAKPRTLIRGALVWMPTVGYIYHLTLIPCPRPIPDTDGRPLVYPEADLEHQVQRSNPKHPRNRSLLTQGLGKKKARLRRVKRVLASRSAHIPSLGHPRLTTLRVIQNIFYSQTSLNANDLPVMLDWEAAATPWTIQELKARASKFVEWDGK